jgi:hypothetical protein
MKNYLDFFNCLFVDFRLNSMTSTIIPILQDEIVMEIIFPKIILSHNFNKWTISKSWKKKRFNGLFNYPLTTHGKNCNTTKWLAILLNRKCKKYE